MRHLPALASLLVFALPAQAERTLSALAEEADLVAVAQLIHTEYRTHQDQPNRGFAVLNILIPYKRPDDQNIAQVWAEGRDPSACYYPVEPGANDRFLVFLRLREDGQYEGEKPWCQLPVHVVADDSQYALRYPVPGVGMPSGVPVQNLQFADRAAFIDPASTDVWELRRIRETWQVDELADGRLRYRQGVLMGDVRLLMFPEGLPPPPMRPVLTPPRLSPDPER
ncbi:MAG TPA: hypothetical protein PKZ76_12320 [Xanthomonadaceae bacterium]|nr:hypothetical protein [Xanthomonadaceae bacterium]